MNLYLQIIYYMASKLKKRNIYASGIRQFPSGDAGIHPFILRLKPMVKLRSQWTW